MDVTALTYTKPRGWRFLSKQFPAIPSLAQWEMVKGSRRRLRDVGDPQSVTDRPRSDRFIMHECSSHLPISHKRSSGHCLTLGKRFYPASSHSVSSLGVFVSLTLMVSTPICSPAERSKFPSLLRYSYLPKQIHIKHQINPPEGRLKAVVL